MKAPFAAFTNHTGIIDFKGHSYFFYHDGALRRRAPSPRERLTDITALHVSRNSPTRRRLVFRQLLLRRRTPTQSPT